MKISYFSFPLLDNGFLRSLSLSIFSSAAAGMKPQLLNQMS
jgi:hypothetical protein